MHPSHIERIWAHLSQQAQILEGWAQSKTKCLRKGVGCSIVHISHNTVVQEIAREHNGPAGQYDTCKGKEHVGSCGCAHAEPRAILQAIKHGWITPAPRGAIVLLCAYSPCTNCANLVLDSKIIEGVVYVQPTLHDLEPIDRLSQAMPCLALDADPAAIQAAVETWCS